MRILALDHFFDQDLASLRRAAGGRHEIRSVHYRYFRDRFRCYFPDEVLGSDLGIFGKERYAQAREVWWARCREATHELYQLYPFDLVVLPSDIFPWIRDLVPAAHELGVPVVVMQKETTLSPWTFDIHARRVARHAPFVSDAMTVCSERQRQFWLDAGAPSDRVTVTGQPRFDLYADESCWASWSELGVPILPGRKVILFLSYALGAYLPSEDVADGGSSWSELRTQTEEVLLGLVDSGDYQLLVKPHPQQPRDDVEAMRSRLAHASKTPGSARVVSPGFDTRHLLVRSDVIVGFQTTALLEALLLGRKVVYTCWGGVYAAYRDAVLPFEEHPEALHTARSPAELEAWIRSSEGEKAGRAHDTGEAARRALFESYLGPADGKACERTLLVLERVAASFVSEDPDGARERRRALRRRRPRFLLASCARLCGDLLVDLPAALAACIAGFVLRDASARRWALEQLALRWKHARELGRALRGRVAGRLQVTGRHPSPWRRGLRHWRSRS